jgi:hypothetical protein
MVTFNLWAVGQFVGEVLIVGGIGFLIGIYFVNPFR